MQQFGKQIIRGGFDRHYREIADPDLVSRTISLHIGHPQVFAGAGNVQAVFLYRLEPGANQKANVIPASSKLRSVISADCSTANDCDTQNV